MERRKFLQWGITGAATALSFLFPGLPSVAARTQSFVVTKPTAPGARDPSFAVGRVLAVGPTGAVIVTSEGQRAIHFHASTKIWKETFVTAGAIKPDDNLYASGISQPDGSLLAQWVHVNITRFDGTITSITAVGMTLLTRRGLAMPIGFSPAIQVISGRDLAPRAGGLGGLAPNQSLGGVGVRLNGAVRATRIWVEE